MLIEDVLHLVEQQFFVTNKEKFTHRSGSRHLLRFTCKHPLLTPDIIVVNDQPFGFRGLNEKLKHLENCPIFCEIEYGEDEGEPYIDYVDIFSEVSWPQAKKNKAFMQQCKDYKEYVIVEQLFSIDSDQARALIMTSRIKELFFDMDLETEDDLVLNTHTISEYIQKFNAFVKELDLCRSLG